MQTPTPAPYSVTRLQAEEIAALAGFLRAYNREDLDGALGYFATKLKRPSPITATDCDYRRQKTVVYIARKGLVQWLRQRFADNDRLTLGRISNENPQQPVEFASVEFARRTSDTLRELGYPRGIVPQIRMKHVFRLDLGGKKWDSFGLASTAAETPNPECALVPPPG